MISVPVPQGCDVAMCPGVVLVAGLLCLSWYLCVSLPMLLLLPIHISMFFLFSCMSCLCVCVYTDCNLLLLLVCIWRSLCVRCSFVFMWCCPCKCSGCGGTVSRIPCSDVMLPVSHSLLATSVSTLLQNSLYFIRGNICNSRS